METHRMTRLRAEDLHLSFDGRTVVEQFTLTIPDGGFTVIIGPNGCGKSTVLRALARLLRPDRGTVILDGHAIASHPAKAVARTLGLLPQAPVAPDGITVRDLVSRGRHPHQRMLRGWSSADEAAVQRALRDAGLLGLHDRFVDELSGGQRQRAWLAMALAQDTDVLLLDEPTTYLDLAHQLEVLELCQQLQLAGRTVVAVLHDLNQAARYATHLVAMQAGRIAAEGAPADVLSPALIRDVFSVDALVTCDPVAGTPMVVPIGPRRPAYAGVS
jgi:iron complex transport system ATP-binding protein